MRGHITSEHVWTSGKCSSRQTWLATQPHYCGWSITTMHASSIVQVKMDEALRPRLSGVSFGEHAASRGLGYASLHRCNRICQAKAGSLEPLLLGIRRRMDSNCLDGTEGEFRPRPSANGTFLSQERMETRRQRVQDATRHCRAVFAAKHDDVPNSRGRWSVRRGFHSDALDLTSIKFGIRKSDRGQGSQDFRADRGFAENVWNGLPLFSPIPRSQLPPRRTRARAQHRARARARAPAPSTSLELIALECSHDDDGAKSGAYNLHALACFSECYPAECILPPSRERRKTLTARPCYTTIYKGREEYDRRSGSRFHDDESSHQASQTSIYPASRAAQRLRPNAPQLFQHSARRGLGQDDDKQAVAETHDERLLHPSQCLHRPRAQAYLHSACQSCGEQGRSPPAKLALLIKRRKEELCAPSDKVEFDPSERIVFLAIMRALAPHGLLQEVQAVSDDMRSFGFSECIDSLNHLLEAAVISARREAIDDILDRIRNLPPPASAPQAERSSKLANLLFNAKPDMSRPGQTVAMEMPLDYMQNWNATTFAHLLESACQDHNLEMASLMLSSCYRLGFTLPHRHSPTPSPSFSIPKSIVPPSSSQISWSKAVCPSP